MNEHEKKDIDLSSLVNLDLAPNWSSENYKTTVHKDKFSSKRKNPIERKAKKTYSESFREAKEITVLIHVKNQILEKLKNKIRKAGITYSISEIVDAVASDINRLQYKISFDDKKSDKKFLVSRTTSKIYLDKKSAIDDLIINGIEDKIIDTEIAEEKTPSGKFDYVFICPLTEKILPPSNFHEFERIVTDHMISSNIKTEIANYCKSLNKVKDNDIIQKWSQEPLQSFGYILKKNQNRIFKNLEQIRTEINNNLFEEYFSEKNLVCLQQEELTLLPRHLKDYINQFVTNKNNWYKTIFLDVLICMKRSKFSIYKDQDRLCISPYPTKSIGNSEVTEISSKIITAIKSKKKVYKKDIVKDNKLACFERKNILLEMKWLIEQGYISEFSDSRIKLN